MVDFSEIFLCKILDYLDTDSLRNKVNKNLKLSNYYFERSYKNNFSDFKLKNLNYHSTITKNVSTDHMIEDKFCYFKSFNGIDYCAFGDNKNSISIYNLNKFKVDFKIENSHLDSILSIKHFFDEIGKKDYLISTSKDKSLKIWVIDQILNNIITRNTIHTDRYCYINSHFIFSDTVKGVRNNLLVTSSYFDTKIKLFYMLGSKLNEIDNNDRISYLLLYRDNKINYVIVCGWNLIRSYMFTKDKLLLYKIYVSKFALHTCAFVNSSKHLIELDFTGKLVIWDFHKANILKKYCHSFLPYGGFCLWNEKFTIHGLSNKFLGILSLSTGEISHICKIDYPIYCIKKFIHTELGTCLICLDSNGILNLFYC